MKKIILNFILIITGIALLISCDSHKQERFITSQKITNNYLVALKQRALLLGLKNRSYWNDEANNHSSINPQIILKTSLSSDDHYAFTTSLNHDGILWDLVHNHYRVITHHAVIYSGFFIQNSHNFMWQEDKNFKTYIQNINGKILDTIIVPQITYQLITPDWNHYFGVSCGYTLYEKSHGSITAIKKGSSVEQFCLGTGKLFNIELSPNNEYLLTSGFSSDNDTLALSDEQLAQQVSTLDGVVLWKVTTGKPLIKFPGTFMGTIATFSPDGKFILSGDELNFIYLWDAKTHKKSYSGMMLFSINLIMTLQQKTKLKIRQIMLLCVLNL